MTSNAALKAGRRYRLLPQMRFAQSYLGISLTLLLVSAGLFIWNPPVLSIMRPVLLVTAVLGALILTMVVLIRMTSFVVCEEDGFLLHFPFRSFLVPYAKIRAIRPDAFHRIFPPGQQSSWQQAVMSGVWSRTVIAVDLVELPWPRRELRVWGGKYLLQPGIPGIVLAVEDWIALRSELDQRNTAWRVRQRTDSPEAKRPFWMT